MLWAYASTGVLFLLQLVVLAVLARTLTPSAFGIMGLATIVVTFANLVAQLGIGQALVQRASLDDRAIRVVFTVSTSLGLVIAAIAAGMAPLLADFFREPMVAPIVRVVTLSFPLLGVGVAAEALLQREFRFRALGAIQVASYVVGYGAVAVVLSLLGFGVWSLAFATVAQSLVRMVLTLAVRRHPKRPAWDPQVLRALVGYGGGLTLSKLFNTIAIEGDYIVVGRSLGPAALGIYSRSYQMMLIPVTLVGQGVSRVLFPSLSRIQDDPAKLRESYLTASGAITLLGLAMSAGMVVLAPEIVAVVLGDQWRDAVLPLRILAAALVLRLAYKLDDAMAKATGRLYARAMRDLVYAATVIGGAVLALPYGLPGVATAVGGAIALNYVLGVRLSLAITRTGTTRYLAAQGPAVVLGALTACLALATRAAAAALIPAAPFVLAASIFATVIGLALVVWSFPSLLGTRNRSLVYELLSLIPPAGLVRSARTRVHVPRSPERRPPEAES